MPTVRRRPWGQLWAAAPWDGKARPDEPLRIPATDAALIDTPPPLGTLSLKRRAWGRLFAAAPWKPRPRPVGGVAPPPAPEAVGVSVADLFAALEPPPAPHEPAVPPPPSFVEDAGGVSFDFSPADDAGATMRMTPPTEVM
jgi:hypothetical protein